MEEKLDKRLTVRLVESKSGEEEDDRERHDDERNDLEHGIEDEQESPAGDHPPELFGGKRTRDLVLHIDILRDIEHHT